MNVVVPFTQTQNIYTNIFKVRIELKENYNNNVYSYLCTYILQNVVVL